VDGAAGGAGLMAPDEPLARRETNADEPLARRETTDEPLARREKQGVQQVIEDALDERSLVYSHHEGAHGGPAGIVVELPGERKLKTNTILTVGEHSVRVEAFVCRQPDENHENVYRFLLKRNRRLYGVSYTLDNIGDIYLVGRMALLSVTADFPTSIRKEWDWRVSRGESLKNLQAFAHLIEERDAQDERSEA
jgi:hypothetical protein